MAPPLRAAALSLLAILIAIAPSCRRRGPAGPIGPAGPSGGFDTAVLPAPFGLRLTAHPGGPPHYVLRWTMPTPNTAIGSFVVYAATTALPLVLPDPTAIIAVVGGAARLAEIELASDTGMRHLRVGAINESGIAGTLSDEFVVDTTARPVFEAAVNENSDLLSLPPTEPSTLTNYTERTAGGPGIPGAVSPDGRTIAWIDAGRLFVRALDGSDAAPIDVTGQLVADGQVWDAFDWSPDGRRIAFAANKLDVDKVEVFVATLGSGAEPVKISGTMVGNGVPVAQLLAVGAQSGRNLVVWSPDNRRVAYAASQRDVAITEVMVATADGLVEPAPAAGESTATASFQFAWSPDGARIAFTGELRLPGVDELFVADGTRTASPALVSGILAAGQQVPAGSFGWSPDGTRILFLSDRRSVGHVEPWIADPTGTNAPTPLFPFVHATADTGAWAWSPDGTEVAFVADLTLDERFEVYLAPATGGTNPIAVSGVIVTGGDAIDLAWARDGAQIAFRASKENRFVQSLYVAAPPFTDEPVRLSNQFDQVTEFAWSTSGDRVAYISDIEGTELLIASRHGISTPVSLLFANGIARLRWSRLGSDF